MKIATVAVYVENQQDALRFWTEKVGFVVHRTQPMGPEASWIEAEIPAPVPSPERRQDMILRDLVLDFTMQLRELRPVHARP
jgi:catechol 2,3-dioxygenase-like lactoylglutathione lyase family enzyme